MNRRNLLLGLGGVLLAPGARAFDLSSVLEARAGSLPLLLTVPHDGGDLLGMFTNRTKGATVRDAGTRDLAERVADLMQQQTGRGPYLVIARFSRKQIDANRPEAEALESAGLLPAYTAYHAQVAAYVAEIREKYPAGGLLVDVHGQSDDPSTTFRGTRSGLTATRLLNRFGPVALQGERSITGILAAKGYAVNPPPDAQGLWEDPRFSGGYTVATYGSHRPDGIDAIQLEFGRQHRASARLAEDFTAALLEFMASHDLIAR